MTCSKDGPTTVNVSCLKYETWWRDWTAEKTPRWFTCLSLFHRYSLFHCRMSYKREAKRSREFWMDYISGKFADASRKELTCILVDVVNANQLELTAGYTSKKLECIRQIDTMRVDTVARDIKPLINRLLCTQLTPLYPSLVTVVYSPNKLTSVHAQRFPSESNRNESNLARVNFSNSAKVN